MITELNLRYFSLLFFLHRHLRQHLFSFENNRLLHRAKPHGLYLRHIKHTHYISLYIISCRRITLLLKLFFVYSIPMMYACKIISGIKQSFCFSSLAFLLSSAYNTKAHTYFIYG